MKWFFVGLVTLIILFFALLPTMVSHPRGQKLLLSAINSRIPGKISVEKLKINWLGNQEVDRLIIQDATDKEIVHIEKMTTDASLFSLLFSSYLGNMKIFSPFLYLSENQKEELNLDLALGKKGRKEGKKSGFDLRGDLEIVDGQIQVSSFKIVPITLSKFNLQLKRDKEVLFHLSALTQQGTTAGDILVSGSFNKELALLATIHNFPMALLDQLADSKLYEVAIGKTLNADIEIIKKEKFLNVKAHVDATNLQGVIEGHTEDKNFYLEKGELNFAVTPPFFKALFPSKEWDLANKPQLKLDIEKLVFPLLKERITFQKIPFVGKIHLERAEVQHHALGALSFNEVEATLTTTAEHINLDYSGSIRGKGETHLQGDIQYFPGKYTTFKGNYQALPVSLIELVTGSDIPILHSALGENFNLLFQGEKGEKIDLTFNIEATTCKLLGRVEGADMKDLVAKVEGDLLVPRRLTSIIGPHPHLNLEAHLSIHEGIFAVPSLSATIKNAYIECEINGKLGEKDEPFDYKNVHLSAAGSLFHLPVPNNLEDYEGSFYINFDGSKNQALGSVKLKTSYDNKEAVHIDIDAKNLIVDNQVQFRKSDLDIRGKLKNFPVDFFDYYLNKETKFLYLLGPQVDVDGALIFSPSQSENAQLDLVAKSAGFLVELSFTIDKEVVLKQSKPAKLRWELTPERYNYLIQMSGKTADYLLADSAWVDITMEKLNCQKLAPLSLATFMCKGGFQGKVDISNLTFQHKNTREIVTFENMSGVISGEDFSKSMVLVLSTAIKASSIPTNEKSGFSWKIEALDLFTEDMKWNKEHFTLKADLIFDLIPVKAVTDIIPLDGSLKETIRAFLGPLVNAHMYGEIAQLTGPVTIDIKASNFKGIFPLQFYDGALTLRSAVEAEITLTEEINKVVLKDVNPILIHGAWSDHPLKLYIDNNGFYFPLRNYTFRRINIEKAIIDLGKLRVMNGGDIQSLMTFLKAKEVTPEGVMEAWFTPIFMSLKDGVTSCKRFDALLGGNVHIAMWGRIDLNRDRVRMTLGISPTTLQQRFNIAGLSKKEMFQVKMRGSTTDLEMDWSSAYTRIGILLTRTAGGHIGYLLGGLLEQLMGLVGEENTPDPTTYPLPWDREVAPPTAGIPQETTHNQSGAKKGFKKLVEFLIP